MAIWEETDVWAMFWKNECLIYGLALSLNPVLSLLDSRPRFDLDIT